MSTTTRSLSLVELRAVRGGEDKPKTPPPPPKPDPYIKYTLSDLLISSV